MGLDILEFTSPQIAEVIAYIPELFSNLWLLVALAIGLPLGFWAVRKVISLVKVR